MNKCSYCKHFTILIGSKEDMPYCCKNNWALEENRTCKEFIEEDREEHKERMKHYREVLGWYD